MKTTYKEIVEASGGLSKLLDKQLRPAQAIALARLCKQLNAELALFRAQQEKIMGDYDALKGTSQEQVRKMEELLAVEVEIPGVKVVLTLDEIDAGTVMATEPFVTIEEAGS